jgi:hypothetical protein
VNKWRNFQLHHKATDLSPLFYESVRINHVVISSSLQQLMDHDDANYLKKKMQIITTKYYKFEKEKMVWRGVRKSKDDEWFFSMVEYQQPRPFVFANFLGYNAFEFYKQIVGEIGIYYLFI